MASKYRLCKKNVKTIADKIYNMKDAYIFNIYETMIDIKW